MEARNIVEAFLQTGQTSISLPRTERLPDVLAAIGSNMIEGDLASVAVSSMRAITLASAELDGFLARSVDFQPVSAAAAEAVLAIALTALTRSPDGDARVAQLRDLLRSSDNPSENAALFVEGIAAGEIDPFENLGRRARSQRVDPRLSYAMLARGLLGQIHTAFNDALERPNRLPSASEESLSAGIANLEHRFAEELDQRIQRIWTACQDVGRTQSLMQEAILLRQFARENVVGMGHVAAHGRRIYSHRIEGGRGGAAEELGQVLVRLHHALRTTIAASVAASRLALASRNLEQEQTLQEVLNNAARLPFDGELPNGVNRQIHQLDADDEGRFVEINAHVVGFSAENDDEDRLIGRIELQDPSSAATTTAVGLFVNPSRIGITVGAHFACSGVFRQALDLNDGAPGILIDRLPLAELAAQQWRVAFLRAGLDVFPVWRNGHNMAWSLGPHLFGGGLDASPGGASEGVFLDFGIDPPTPRGNDT